MSDFDSVLICDVLKPSCIIARAVAITIGKELTLAPQEDPIVLGARAQALYVRIAPSMIPWFIQKECANMMVRWSEFLLEERMIDNLLASHAAASSPAVVSDTVNDDEAASLPPPPAAGAAEETRHSTRIRRNPLRFKPSQNR